MARAAASSPSPPVVHPLLHEDPEIHRRRWFLLGIMCLSLVLVVMSVSGLNVALPTMQSELDASAAELQWIVDAYALVFAGLLLTAGALGDRFGRRRALLWGLAIFAAGAVVSGVATGAGQVIVGRVVMGLGAAFVMPATLSLIATIFPPEERRRAIALWAGFAGAGGAIGPIVSGALLERYWWGSALLLNLPVVVGIILAVAVFAPTSRDPERAPLDPAGALLSLVGVATLVFAIIEGPEKGWTSATVLSGFVVAGLSLGLFLWWERRVPHPMLPLDLFRDRRFSVGSGVITAAFFIMFGLFFLITQYLQFVRAYSPLEAGLATLPMAVALVVVAPRSAALAERLGTGPVISLGFLLVAAGFVIMAVLSPATSYAAIAGSFVLLGMGLGITVAPATGNIMSSVPHAKAGVGSAVNDTTRELGGALGIAVLGSLVNASYRSSVDLDGLQLPAEVARAAEESVGAASAIAPQLPSGAELTARAGQAFTDAFNLSSAFSVALALAAAATVITVFGRRAEREAEARAVASAPVGPMAEPPVPAMEPTG